jgi:hypothetical protein
MLDTIKKYGITAGILLVFAVVGFGVSQVPGCVGLAPAPKPSPEPAAPTAEFEVPTQKITLPNLPPAGGLVIATLSKPDKEVSGLKAIVPEWLVLENGESQTNVYITEGGQNALFTYNPKSQTIVLVSLAYIFDDGKNFAVKQGAIQYVQVGKATPPVPPEPPKPGEPTFEPGAYGLAEFTYKGFTSTVAQQLRVKGAAAMGTSFRGIQAAIVAGTLKSVPEILKVTRESNNAALKEAGLNPRDFDTFGTMLQEKLFATHESGKLSKVADYAVAWGEISEGLSKVK